MNLSADSVMTFLSISVLDHFEREREDFGQNIVSVFFCAKSDLCGYF